MPLQLFFELDYYSVRSSWMERALREVSPHHSIFYSYVLRSCRVGTDVMFHLLTEASLFLSLPNDCFCQIAGEPVINSKPPATIILNASTHPAPLVRSDHLKRPSSNSEIDQRPTKRLKVNHDLRTTAPAHVAGMPSKAAKDSPDRCAWKKLAIFIISSDWCHSVRSPADISISRPRVFFSRPNRAGHTQKILFGLPAEREPAILLLSQRDSYTND